MRRGLVALFALTAFGTAACGYADPYGGSAPVANESPNPSGAPSASPGTDDCHSGDGLPSVTYPDGLKVIDRKVGTGASA